MVAFHKELPVSLTIADEVRFRNKIPAAGFLWAPLVLIMPKSLWFLWRKKRVLPLLGTAGEKTGSLPVSPRGEGFSKGVTRAFISV
jgi:hypothetical protein